MTERGKKDQVTMAMRKPRTNSRVTTKNGQQQAGATERDEDGGERGAKPRKRKLSDMLGPPWSKDDLELFYHAYRKFGKDWKKVVGGLQRRTMEMVEALYGMNKAYLSLPDGMASAEGLIAMMTDHYNNILDESEEQSSDETGTSTRPRIRIKPATVPSASLGPSGYGGPSPAKKRRSATGRPWVVGKRTPRYPTANTVDQKPKSKAVSNKVHQEESSEEDEDLRKEAEVGALTLLTASQQGVLASMTRITPTRKYGRVPLQNGHVKESSPKTESPALKRTLSKGGDATVEASPENKHKRGRSSSGGVVDYSEFGGDGSKGNFSENRSRWKKPTPKKPKVQKGDESITEPRGQDREAGSKGEEPKDDDENRHTSSAQKRKQQSLQRAKKPGRQLFSGDQSIGLDALATLAGLSLNGLLPSSTPCSDSEKEQDRPEKLELDFAILKAAVERSNEIERKEEIYVDQEDEKPGEQPDKEENQVVSGTRPRSTSPPDSRKRKRKTIIEKTAAQGKPISDEDDERKAEPQDPPTRVETPVVLKPRRKPKRLITTKTVSKQGLKGNKVEDSSVTDVDPPSQGVSNSATADEGAVVSSKLRSKKGLPEKGLANGSGDASTSSVPQASCPHSSTDFGPFTTKARLIHCLSPKVQRWCMYEWFYSAIELPWFANNEFVEYLHHAGLGHVPRLTRVEWGVIRSSLGKPRRLSKSFLDEERKKLASYRESVRTHYQDLRNGLREGLPSDLARPLTVGQRVIAKHPKTRQIHDGSILTVDRSRCRVQFDRPELGVEFVKDIDAMPVHPMENMSEMMRRKRIALDAADRPIDDLGFEPKPQVALSAGGVARAALNEKLERPGYPLAGLPLPQSFLSNLTKAAQTSTVESIVFAKAAIGETIAANQNSLVAQHMTGQSLGTESDVQALVKLSDLFSQKEPVVSELLRLNDETEACKSSETFQQQFSSISLLLNDVNSQILDVIKYLQSRNKYQENLVQLWPRGGVVRNGDLVGPREGSPMGANEGFRRTAAAEIAASSRKHARAMVSAAMQSMSSLQEDEDPLTKVGGALDSIWKGIPPVRRTASSGAVSVTHSLEPATTALSVGAGAQSSTADANGEADKPVEAHRSFPEDTASQNNEVAANADAAADHVFNGDKDSMDVSELMTSCVGALLMVQALAEQQCSAAEVGHVINLALESLRPQAAQNYFIYKDIEKQLAQIKGQILVPSPMQSGVHQFPVEAPVLQPHIT